MLSDRETAAKHFKVKPSTLRRRRYKLGHDTQEVWINFMAEFYMIFSDKRIEKYAYQVRRFTKTL